MSVLIRPIRSVVSALVLCAVAFALPACDSSDNAGGIDSGTVSGDGGVLDAPQGSGGNGGLSDALENDGGPAVIGCTGRADGTNCSGNGTTGLICLSELCFTSTCGDGFVDKAKNEQCEDDNDKPGDGCTFCKFDCAAAADCDDKQICNGAETCDAAKHSCTGGTPAAANTVCTLEAGGAGTCSQGACVQAGCGDGIKGANEDCDDKNADDADGCTRDCKFTCVAAADCDDKNACTGAETCDVAKHVCVAGTTVVCESKACNGTCEPATGKCLFPDADKDGSLCSVDCNDADPAVLPGGFECKDGKDNDCNAQTVDSSAPTCECYVDTDKDGFASSVTGAIVSAGTCPVAYTRVKPVDSTNIDCAASLISVFPGQTNYFTTAYCTGKGCILGVSSYDYNCDTLELASRTRLTSSNCTGTTILTCSSGSGWLTAVPACGGTGTFRSCLWARTGGCTLSDAKGELQACR